MIWFLSLLIFATQVLADVSISRPITGQTFTVSGSSVSIPIEWTDDGTTPDTSDASSFTFTLCTGSNSDITAISTIASGVTASDSKYTASISSSAASDGVYYIQIYATYAHGYSIHYSNRFKLSGMSGTVKSSGSLTDTPPQAQVSYATTTTSNPLTTMDVSASFTVPYTLQTGLYRFAPMQMQPGSTVTATTWTRQFPTSAVTYYTAPRPSPDHFSTITPGWSYTKTSIINPAKALGTPTAKYSPTISKRPTINSALSKRFLHLD